MKKTEFCLSRSKDNLPHSNMKRTLWTVQETQKCKDPVSQTDRQTDDVPRFIWPLTAKRLESWVRLPLEAWIYVLVFLRSAVVCRQRPWDRQTPFKESYRNVLNGFVVSEVRSESEQARRSNPWNIKAHKYKIGELTFAPKFWYKIFKPLLNHIIHHIYLFIYKINTFRKDKSERTVAPTTCKWLSQFKCYCNRNQC